MALEAILGPRFHNRLADDGELAIDLEVPSGAAQVVFVVPAGHLYPCQVRAPARPLLGDARRLTDPAGACPMAGAASLRRR